MAISPIFGNGEPPALRLERRSYSTILNDGALRIGLFGSRRKKAYFFTDRIMYTKPMHLFNKKFKLKLKSNGQKSNNPDGAVHLNSKKFFYKFKLKK